MMSKTDSHYDEREQSEIKHFALRLYLEAATRILGTTKNFRYVDCCAGPWKNRLSTFEDTSFGIATNVLNKAADDLLRRGLSRRFAALMIENRPDAFAKLKEFAEQHDSPSLRIHARNWDFTARVADIVRYCSRPQCFPFVFIDPTGWQLAGISKISPLLRLSPGEVLINLMSPFIARFIKDNSTDFSDLLGTDFPALRAFSGTELEMAIVDKYRELIRKEGAFKYVCSLPVMNPDMDSFNFHLIYGTRHRKGVAAFKDVERRTAEKTDAIRAELQQKGREAKSGNFELFAPEVKYTGSGCYQRLKAANHGRANRAVLELIQTSRIASYDDCWAEALQFSTVHESDLRQWVSEWQVRGLVETKGLPPRSKVLQVGREITLLARSDRSTR